MADYSGPIGGVPGGKPETLGYSPKALKNLFGSPPLVPPERDESGLFLKAIGIERVLLPTQVWRDPSFNPGQPTTTPNQIVLSGRFHGFRIEPFSTSPTAAPFFNAPRTIITKGLAKSEGGDGQTKIWPIATRGWYPHAFSSLQFGLESAGANATDGPWEVWGAETPEAMLISLAELLTTGYVRDATTGLYTLPAQTGVVQIGGFSVPKPVLIVDQTGATATTNAVTLASPFDMLVGQMTFITSASIPGGVEVDINDGVSTRKYFTPAIGAATTAYATLAWGGQTPSGNITIPGTPPGGSSITVPAQANLTSVRLTIWKDY